MKIVTDKISIDELKAMSEKMFGNLVKAVVDLDKKIMAVDAELHADEEALLLQNGSKQADLWGVNLYPEITGDDWLEFDSMINLRPSQGNRSRSVEDSALREKIKIIINQLVQR